MEIFLVVILGAVIGILINYFSDVLPVSRRLSHPLCKECDQPYKAEDYIIGFGCANCGGKRSKRTYIVLVSAVVLCVLLYYFPFSRIGFLASIPILLYFGVVIVVDIEHRLVLIETSIFGLALFLVYGILIKGVSKTLYGALGGFLVMLFFYLLGIAFTKIVGKFRNKDLGDVVFGFGDVMLGTILGLLTGWSTIIEVLTVAFVVFGIFSIGLILGLLLLKRYKAFGSYVPFTPFLIIGAVVLLYL